MIHKVEMYTAVCDNCGLDIGSLQEYSCWNDERYAKDNAIDSDWIEEDGKLYCPSCYSISSEDKIYINEERRGINLKQKQHA